jgi:GNAT superfamily N-acetyltransferase
MSKLGQTAPASTLDSALLELVDSYWTEFLDCAPDTLRRQTVQLVVHAALGDYAGCYLMEFGGAPIVSLPVHEVESYRAAVTRWHPGIVRMPELVEAVFGERVAATIGPAFVGYIDVAHFRPVSPGAARQIAHIAVVTHPGFRGHGYARTVVSTLTEIALGRTFVPQYRTLEANAPSIAVARRLGFLQYATSLAVRFTLPNTKGNCDAPSNTRG